MNNEHGLKAEKRAAKRAGARLVPGSGSGPINKGDFVFENYLVENKTTINKSLSLKFDWLRQIAFQAMERTRVPALFFQFSDKEGRPHSNGRWVCIPESHFLEIMEKD